MAYQNPSIQDFKDYFSRDFPFGPDPETQVTDGDIGKAYQLTNATINPRLFPCQDVYTIGYLLLSAHYLVTNLRASSQGINGQYSFIENSKSVGNVSQGFAIPERILNDPVYTMYTKTNYGAQYLMLVLPYLNGVMFTVAGTTRP